MPKATENISGVAEIKFKKSSLINYSNKKNNNQKKGKTIEYKNVKNNHKLENKKCVKIEEEIENQ